MPLLDNRADLNAEEHARLSKTVEGHRSLEDVLQWGRVQRTPFEIADIVVQDEFTHDFVLSIGNGLYLVYDTT
jgi:hypothetical protein